MSEILPFFGPVPQPPVGITVTYGFYVEIAGDAKSTWKAKGKI